MEQRRRLWLVGLLAATIIAVAACTSSGGGDPQPSTDSTPAASPTRQEPACPAERGAELYAAQCQACHGDARTGSGASAGAPSHGPDGHTWHHPNAQLADLVLDRKRGLGVMPAFRGRLSAGDVDAILTYIKAGWTEEQRAAQAEVSGRYEEALRQADR